MSPIAEAVREEASTERQQHLAELGASMAMVVHELRNPITTIGARLGIVEESLTQDMLSAPPGALRSLAKATEELARMRRMLDSLLAYSRNRQEVKVRESVALPEVIERAIEFVCLKHGRHAARFSVLVKDQRPVVDGDRDALFQAIVNLVDNAVTAAVPERRLAIAITLSRLGDDFEIAIQDNGCGMSPELVQQVFAPFITARPNGTGLGMPVVQRIIRDHGGSTHLSSQIGVGTTIQVLLPVGIQAFT